MYNLFISHSWAHTDAYDRLVDLLDSASNFPYKNYSVQKNSPIHDAPTQWQLKEAIKALGTHSVTVRVHPEITGKIEVKIIQG